MLSFLYFLSYSPLLSSFPTRRSSDLAARCGDPLLVIGPERVQPCQVVGARLRRHAVANERLHEGFVLADAEYIDLDVQHLQGVSEIVAKHAVTLEINLAQRVQIDGVRKAGQIILILVVIRRPSEHRLAGFLEVPNRTAQFLQLAWLG